MTVRLLVPAYGKQTSALYTGTTAAERALIDAGQADNNLSASFDYADYLAGKSMAPLSPVNQASVDGATNAGIGFPDLASRAVIDRNITGVIAYPRRTDRPVPVPQQSKLMFRANGLTGVTFSTGANAPTATAFDRTKRRQDSPFDGMIKVQTPVGAYSEAFLSINPVTTIDGIGAWISVDDWANVSQLVFYAGDTGYANFYNVAVSKGAGLSVGTRYADQGPVFVWMPRSSFAVNGSPVSGTTSFSQLKVRVIPQAGKSATAWINDLTFSMPQDRAKIVISSDDEQLPFFTNALPILDARGIKSSFGIIGSLVGTSGAASLAQLQAAVANGHECNIHGPIGGVGSLRNYNNYNDVYADVVSNRDYVVNNGLATNGSEKIYIYPQGYADLVPGDDIVMSALRNAGFVMARGVQDGTTKHIANLTALGARATGMSLPIIGHQAVIGNDAPNIAAIQTRIDEVITQKSTGILMFHAVQSAAASSPDHITIADFTTLMDYVALKVAQGSLEVCRMTDLARYGGLLP